MRPSHQIASGRAVLAAEVSGSGAIGSGDPVIFLHANICDRRMWRDQLDAIGAGHQSIACRAIAYDRRGFGETRAEAEEHSAVDDLMAVLDATTEGRPAILVGCSQGGRIAIDATLRYPASVRDRKGAGEGKSVSVGVAPGGRRNLQKKKTKQIE